MFAVNQSDALESSFFLANVIQVLATILLLTDSALTLVTEKKVF
jgi:hypothetical protein